MQNMHLQFDVISLQNTAEYIIINSGSKECQKIKGEESLTTISRKE